MTDSDRRTRLAAPLILALLSVPAVADEPAGGRQIELEAAPRVSSVPSPPGKPPPPIWRGHV